MGWRSIPNNGCINVAGRAIVLTSFLINNNSLKALQPLWGKEDSSCQGARNRGFLLLGHLSKNLKYLYLMKPPVHLMLKVNTWSRNPSPNL